MPRRQIAEFLASKGIKASVKTIYNDIFLLQHGCGGPVEYNAKPLTHQKAKVFDMYSGDEYTVRLRVQNRLADAVIDKFGKETIMTPADENHFTVLLPVEISPPFLAWVATFGKGTQILSPAPAVKGMKDFIRKVSEMYS